jgi:outer membrane protein, heavy metal efflux system
MLCSSRSGYCLKVIVLAFLSLAGCSTLPTEEPFSQIAESVRTQIGKRISWDAGQYGDPLVRSTIEKLLSRPLTPETAVQIALLNNRELQSTYADLGIAQANLVQATLWKNPIITGGVFFPITGGGIDYTFDFVLRVIDIVYIPLRKQVAESQLEEAKFQVTARVMSTAGQTYQAFIDYVGERERVNVLKRAVESASAIIESGKVLRKAGNITDFDFEAQVSLQIQFAGELARAQLDAAEARERVNRLLGLTGPQTQWRAPDRLPRISGRERLAANAERTAIEASLDLGAVRQRLITMGRKYRIVDITSVLPKLDLGGREDRSTGEDEAGPLFVLELAVFDWGQARREAARMEILKTRDEFTALAVRVRSSARLQQAKLLSARQIAVFYANTVIPQAQRFLEAAEKQYKAMEVGIFDLLEIKEKQIRVSVEYVAALKAYWRERVRLAQTLKGKLPDDADETKAPAAEPAAQSPISSTIESAILGSQE